MTKVLGIDPGPQPGIVMLDVQGGAIVSWRAVPAAELDAAVRSADLVSVERFRISQRTVKSTKAGSTATIEQIGHICGLAAAAGVRVVQYGPDAVKPWATDQRLRAWRLSPKGDHYRDAARHALYAAVQARLLPLRAPAAPPGLDV